MCIQQGVLAFISLERASKSEVCKLDLLVFCEQDVCRFQIAMDDIFAIKCDHGVSNLLEELLGFKFRECTPQL